MTDEKIIPYTQLVPGQVFRFTRTEDCNGEYPFVTVGVYGDENFIFWKLSLAWTREHGYDDVSWFTESNVYSFNPRDKVCVKDEQAQDD